MYIYIFTINFVVNGKNSWPLLFCSYAVFVPSLSLSLCPPTLSVVTFFLLREICIVPSVADTIACPSTCAVPVFLHEYRFAFTIELVARTGRLNIFTSGRTWKAFPIKSLSRPSRARNSALVRILACRRSVVALITRYTNFTSFLSSRSTRRYLDIAQTDFPLLRRRAALRIGIGNDQVEEQRRETKSREMQQISLHHRVWFLLLSEKPALKHRFVLH